jgi:aspartate kinase
MKVLKFGGTSVGSVENICNVKNIIDDGNKKIVVLSAMSGTTNALVAIANNIANNMPNEAIDKINKLHEAYFNTVDKLLTDESLNNHVKNYVTDVFNFLVECTYTEYSLHLENKIVAQGELLSTFMFNSYLKQEGITSTILPALSFMRIDSNKEPDLFYIKQDLKTVMDDAPDVKIYITQGFICLDEEGNIANLQRGGSDYTATIIGAVIKAEEVEIWTDIDGMHNNDPRHVENTHPISKTL